MSKSYESKEAEEYAYRYHYAPLHRYNDDSDDDYNSGDQQSVRRQKPQRPTEMATRLQMLQRRGEKDPTSWFYKGPKKVHFRSQEHKTIYQPVVTSDAQKRQGKQRVAKNYASIYSISTIRVHILVDKQGLEYVVPERFRVSINKLPPNFMYFGGHEVLQEIVPVSLPNRKTEHKPVIYNIGHRRKQQTSNVSTIIRFTQNGNNLETDAGVITPLTNNDLLTIIRLGKKQFVHDEKVGVSYKIVPVPVI